jgi:hypothetical protein
MAHYSSFATRQSAIFRWSASNGTRWRTKSNDGLVPGVRLEHPRATPGSIGHALPPGVSHELLRDRVRWNRERSPGVVSFFHRDVGQSPQECVNMRMLHALASADTVRPTLKPSGFRPVKRRWRTSLTSSQIAVCSERCNWLMLETCLRGDHQHVAIHDRKSVWQCDGVLCLDPDLVGRDGARGRGPRHKHTSKLPPPRPRASAVYCTVKPLGSTASSVPVVTTMEVGPGTTPEPTAT